MKHPRRSLQAEDFVHDGLPSNKSYSGIQLESDSHKMESKDDLEAAGEKYF
jgi:hypothetical protein